MEDLKLVVREPDRLDGLLVSWRKKGLTRRLRRMRKTMEREAQDSVVNIESAVYVLYDVCVCLGLNENQTHAVLGDVGWEAVN